MISVESIKTFEIEGWELFTFKSPISCSKNWTKLTDAFGKRIKIDGVIRDIDGVYSDKNSATRVIHEGGELTIGVRVK